MRVVGVFDSTIRLVLGQLGKPFRTTSAKAQRVLGWSPRAMREMVLDTAASIGQRPKSA
jgi:hypothetical protein